MPAVNRENSPNDASQGLRHLDELTQERMRELEAAMLPAQTIRRTGQRPFAFNGSLVAMTCGVTPDLPFWYEINAYRTTSGSWVSDIRLFDKGDASDLFRVAEHDDLDALFDYFENYDPVGDIAPPGELIDGSASSAQLALQTARLQMRVDRIRDHYRGLLGDFLGRIDAAA